MEKNPQQKTSDDEEIARNLLDQLLTDSQLYTQSQDYKNLLDFVVRLRNFAPFNAMLLQIQKPGLSFAASAYDWCERFGRIPTEGARPLVILWPFGPVAFVYDVLDTEGKDLPKDVASFFAQGPITAERVTTFIERMNRKNIECIKVDAGDRNAGAIRVLHRPKEPKAPKDPKAPKEFVLYQMQVNKNHFPPVQFATIAHELGHLFLGHLGPDKEMNVPFRSKMGLAQRELEAESVSYMVCARNGVSSKSETYLKNYVAADTTIDHIDINQIMRAAGQIEALLGLTAHTRFDMPKKHGMLVSK